MKIKKKKMIINIIMKYQKVKILKYLLNQVGEGEGDI